jgi:zinc ribbon protein
VEASAAPFCQNTPFYLVVEMLRQLLAWRADQPSSDRLAQLESRLELAGLKPAEAVPLIAPLVNLPLPANYPPSPLTPERGASFLSACSKCGANLSPEDHFCDSCGHRLGQQTPAAIEPPDPRSYTPKHLAEKILTSRSALRRGTQAGDGALRRREGRDTPAAARASD